MSGTTVWVRRHPVISYFILAYALFWLVLALAFIGIGISGAKPEALPAWVKPVIQIVGAWMAALAALMVTLILDGSSGARKLFGRFLQFRLPAWTYVMAVIPFVLAFAAAAIYTSMGGKPAPGVDMTVSFWLAFLLTQLLAGPTGEEPGWRGFALARLMATHSPLRAGLLVGFVWSFWHLPLWMISGYSGVDLLVYCSFFSVGIVSLSVYMTWLFCRTGGSLVPMTICHFSGNVGLGLVVTSGLGLGPDLPLMAITFTLFAVAAIGVWTVSWATRNRTPTAAWRARPLNLTAH